MDHMHVNINAPLNQGQPRMSTEFEQQPSRLRSRFSLQRSTSPLQSSGQSVLSTQAVWGDSPANGVDQDLFPRGRPAGRPRSNSPPKPSAVPFTNQVPPQPQQQRRARALSQAPGLIVNPATLWPPVRGATSDNSSSSRSTSTQATAVGQEESENTTKAEASAEERLIRELASTLRRTVLQSQPPPRSRSGVTPSHKPRRSVQIETPAVQQSTVKGELDAQKTKSEDGLQDRVSQLRDDLHSLQRKEKQTSKELEDALERLSLATSHKEAAERDRDQEREWRANLSMDLDEQARMIDGLHRALAAQGGHLAGLANERDILREKAAKTEEGLAKTAALYEKLQKELERMQADRKAHEALMVEQIAALEVTKGVLQKRTESLETELASKRVELDNTNIDRDHIRDELAKQDSRLNRLADEKKKLEDENTELQAKVTELEDEKTGLQDEAEALQADKQTDKTRIDELEEETKALKQQVEDLETGKAEHQTHIEALTTERDSLTEGNSTLTTRITEVEDAMTTLREGLSTAEAESKGHEEDKTGLEKEKGELAARVAELEDQTAALAELRNKNGELQAGADKAAALAVEKADLEAAKTSAEARVAELEAKVTCLEAGAAGAAVAVAASAVTEPAAPPSDRTTAADAELVPGLRDQNASLTAQLAASAAVVARLQAQVGQLKAAAAVAAARQGRASRRTGSSARSASVSASSVGGMSSRSRKSAASTATTVTASGESGRRPELVVVRSLGNRGVVRVMRRSDLHSGANSEAEEE